MHDEEFGGGAGEFDDSGGEFGGAGEFDDEVPGDEVLQVVERSDGLTTRSVAAAVGLPEDEAKERLEALRASGELERDTDDEWFVPEQAGADDPYVF